MISDLYILAVDTATTGCSVALLQGETLKAHRYDKGQFDQGKILFSLIDSVLKDENISFKDLALLATTTGPGSFTGLRIGLSAMRGLALALDIPIIGITTFEMFAHASLERIPDNCQNILVITESRRRDLYIQLFSRDLTEIEEGSSAEVGDIKKKMSLNKSCFITGDAAVKLIVEASDNNVFDNEGIIDSSAQSVAILGMQKYLKNISWYSGKNLPAPLYLRAPDVTTSNKLRKLAE